MHEFTGGDGTSPLAALTRVASTFYGTTYRGGTSDKGTIFRVDADGSDFQVVHQFAGGAGDGSFPHASFTLDGSTMYSTTADGGYYRRGTIYRLNTDGSGFDVIYEIGSTIKYPVASLTLVGSKLYGAAQYSDYADSGGGMFRLNADGTGFQSLHIFHGGSMDGAGCHASLTPVGEALYGTTQYGGGWEAGTVFRINPDGTGFGLVHKFTGGAGGHGPMTSLTLVGSTLYGTTHYGGSSGRGTIFRLNPDGSGFQIVHEFLGGPTDGSEPRSALTLVGSTLYGTTRFGGDFDHGTIFRLNTDGSSFQLLHEFAGGPEDGSEPLAALTVDGPMLYGTTLRGGDYDKGTVFALLIPEPSSLALATLAFAGLATWACRQRLLASLPRHNL